MSTLTTYPQGSLLWPKEPVKIGRLHATCSQSFWVTNSSLNQEQTGQVSIARSGKSSGFAIRISLEQAAQFFKAQ